MTDRNPMVVTLVTTAGFSAAYTIGLYSHPI